MADLLDVKFGFIGVFDASGARDSALGCHGDVVLERWDAMERRVFLGAARQVEARNSILTLIGSFHHWIAEGDTCNIVRGSADQKQVLFLVPNCCLRLVCWELKLVTWRERQDMGVTSLPERIVPENLASRKLQRILPEWQGSPSPFYAVTETRRLPAKTQRFIEFLRERLKEE